MTAPARPPARHLQTLQAAVELIAAIGPRVALAAPLGLGKPHRLLNAIHRHYAATPAQHLRLKTALSLTPPAPGSGLQKRFLGPFLERHFGADFPALDYALAMRRDALPSNIEVEEFYLQSGALLHSAQAQRLHNSLNYTHVARAVAASGIDAVVQLVARSPDGGSLSLSCNPDLTLDLVDEVARLGKPRPLLIAEVHPDLPWIGGGAEVPLDWFDAVVELPGPTPELFALPREPVSEADYAIGFLASTLVRDGGSLQVGIGALSDALAHALVLRHTDNARYRAVIDALWPDVERSPLVCDWGGLGPFETGLFGASEMLMDGFTRLVDAGVVRRLVVENVALMRRLVDGTADDDDRARLEREGQYLHGAFFLGSKDLYRWLRELPAEKARRIGMTRVSHINELYGGQEALERLQRREARFFNSCMMMTALGAAVSDALEDGRVVSGVGGQYNFVAMAHALADSRSALMFRAVREHGGRASSNVRWSYGHTTIPRHLRDVAITEYGIADLRGACDEDCVIAMAGITDARFQHELLDAARRAHKLRADWSAPAGFARNTPERLRDALAPFRRDGTLPDYPLGSDFTPVEQRLVRALGWLKGATAGKPRLVATIARALLHRGGSGDVEAMQRMDLSTPHGMGERIEARLLALALERSKSA